MRKDARAELISDHLEVVHQHIVGRQIIDASADYDRALIMAQRRIKGESMKRKIV